MRKLIVVNIISLDAYFEGPGKNVMALPFDPAFDEYNLEVMRGAGSLLFGRTSFEQAKMYWPPIAGDATKGPAEREMSRLFGALDKTVISDGLTHEDMAPWDASTTVVGCAGAHEAVAALKEWPGGPIVIFGSHIVWNDLLNAGLVDAPKPKPGRLLAVCDQKHPSGDTDGCVPGRDKAKGGEVHWAHGCSCSDQAYPLGLASWPGPVRSAAVRLTGPLAGQRP